MKMKEKDIVAAILRLLKKTPGCFAWKEHGSMYSTAGIPDIIACVGGRFVAFEVKVPGNKMTKLQEITIQKIKDAKGQAFMVTSAAEVAAILKEMEGFPDD
jgi:Holliday junction resolvase